MLKNAPFLISKKNVLPETKQEVFGSAAEEETSWKKQVGKWRYNEGDMRGMTK